MRNKVRQEVESSYASFQWSRDRIQLYEQTYLARAKESRDTAEFAFQKGATSILDLLDAERTYRTTELAYHKELAAYLTNLAQLEAAVGASAAALIHPPPPVSSSPRPAALRAASVRSR